MVRLEDILEEVSAYNPSADLDIIKKAYVFSGMVHQGQVRSSGEPYLRHPLEVARILTELKMDASVVATGLLHDTVEDTHTTIEKVEETFGSEIAGLVDGLTKISRITITFEKKEDREAENFRKMVLAMARDIRVILIKLADRLHNMRTLDALGPERQRRIAQETWDIYAPLANRLGIGWMKAELEDLAFKHLEPEKYEELCEKVVKWREDRGTYIAGVKEVIESTLAEHGIKGEVTGRLKHLYSMYRKMKEQDAEFEDIHDIIAFRVIVDSVKDCYAVLGIIHSTWKPVPGRFKDYLAIPKTNLYQSLHTTVVGPYGWKMELQIRTVEMHKVAEYGIAAHWKYKEGKTVDGKDDKRFAWLRQLLEWQRDLKDSDEFMETVKVDLFPEEVFVFTPKGSVKVFPKGATPVDFAYAIHTDVGHRCVGAKVDGKMVPFKQRLRNGNVVEIITSEAHRPSKDWLRFVVTSRAKARIRQWIKAEEREQSIVLGKEILEKQLKKYGLESTRLLKSGELAKVAKQEFGLKGVEHLHLNIGYGKISVHQAITKLLPPERLKPGPEGKVSGLRKVLQRLKSAPETGSRKEGVVIKGVEDIMVRFAKCCNPLPGDDIVGFITHGQGVSIHGAKCPNLLDSDPERQIEVEWDKKIKAVRAVTIEVVCKNEKGLLADMSSAIKNSDANISGADIRTIPDNRAICTFEIEVNDREQLKNTIRSLQKVKKVIKVARVGREFVGSGKQAAL
jgi:GTP pyrophosphokinase